MFLWNARASPALPVKIRKTESVFNHIDPKYFQIKLSKFTSKFAQFSELRLSYCFEYSQKLVNLPSTSLMLKIFVRNFNCNFISTFRCESVDFVSEIYNFTYEIQVSHTFSYVKFTVKDHLWKLISHVEIVVIISYVEMEHLWNRIWDFSKKMDHAIPN